MPTIDNEYSTPKITPADGVKIPSVGENSGYQLDEELREYIQNGVTGVTEQYSTLMTYAYGKRLKHEGVEYRCIVPVESPEIFDPDKWVKVDLTELDKRVLDNADAINAINGDITSLNTSTQPTSFSMTMKSGFVLDWGGLYKVCGMIVGTICIYSASSFTAGTNVDVATFSEYPSVANSCFPVVNCYNNNNYLGTFFIDNGNKKLVFNPATTFTEARMCATIAIKAH
jgi:hypothetical protein